MDKGTVMIRHGRIEDLPLLAEAEKACFPVAEAASAQVLEDRLRHYADHFWLLFRDGTLISYVDGLVTGERELADEMFASAQLHDKHGAWQMIFGVGTLPEFRGRGYAGQLIRRAVEDAHSQGRKGLVLTCKAHMIPFYARFGFVDEGVSGFSSHGGAVWHQMRLTFRDILVLFPCDEVTRLRLQESVGPACRCVFKGPDMDIQTYRNALAAASIIIGEPRNEDFQYCRRLELMQSPSSGVNYYMQGGVFPEGATLCCMTGAYGNVLAEHMLGMVLSLCRRLPEYRDQQRSHLWKLCLYDKQLEGSTVLILGAGDIGTTLARWMRPMVGKIIGVRRVVRAVPDCYDQMITFDRLDEALKQADIVLCALPHTPETVCLLDERRLSLMKKDAVLVNGGRGSLIDQDALCRLLEQGHFWGVGLEVTSPEPLPPEHPLWDQPRLIITPHAAGNSFAQGSPLERKIWEFMIGNVSRYLRSGKADNRVDLSTGYRETV